MATGLKIAILALIVVNAVWVVSGSPVGVVDLSQQVLVGPVVRPDASSLNIILDSKYYTRTTHQFTCQSVKCTGWLYAPKAAAGSSKPPVIVMAHGLGGDKLHLHHYAERFSQSGFAVFSFDYRFWGDSEGEPRRWVVPPKQIEDWLAAVEFVQTDLGSSVDASRLSLWGSSLAGGHVITIASKLGSQIKAVVAQVPHLDGKMARSLNMRNRGLLGNGVLGAVSLADKAAEKTNGPYLYVPLGGPPGSLAIMQLRNEELAAYLRSKGLQATNITEHPAENPAWRTYVTRACFALDPTMAAYSPIDRISAATAPILIVAAKRDGLCPYSAAVAAQQKARNATLVTFDSPHFGIYSAPWLQPAVDKEVEFMLMVGV